MKCEEQELVSLTRFRRNLTSVLERLKTGVVPKVVVVKNGHFECVLLTVGEYERLESEANGWRA